VDEKSDDEMGTTDCEMSLAEPELSLWNGEGSTLSDLSKLDLKNVSVTEGKGGCSMKEWLLNRDIFQI
jgi:hypothetical protein